MNTTSSALMTSGIALGIGGVVVAKHIPYLSDAIA